MRKLMICLYLAGIGLTTTSCRTTTLLNANFKDDVVGTSPKQNIPGNPERDSIWYSSSIEANLRIQALPGSGNKVLEFTNSPRTTIPGRENSLGFRAISTSLLRPIWFVLTGTHSGAAGDITIGISDGRAEIARIMIDRAGKVSLMKPGYVDGTEFIGTISPGRKHILLIGVDMSKGTYSISSIAQQSPPDINVKDKPVIHPILTYANPARPTLSFGFDRTEASADRRYQIESLLITRHEPDMD